MSDIPANKEPRLGDQGKSSSDRLVYVLPEQAFSGAADDEISLNELWGIFWQGKWLIISITAVFAILSITYAFLAIEWYRSEALLVPAEAKGNSSSLGGQLGGLAALAGVSVGGGESVEALAVLKSREFIRSFIEVNDLMPVLFHDDWDTDRREWRMQGGQEPPDIRDGVKYFREDLLRVYEAKDTGLVTLSVEWTNPEVAAEWVTILVKRLNARVRERALQEAETNVAYLQEELGRTGIVTLQQSIGRLLESELQKLMLARGNEEFAFRIVDTADVPLEPIRPRRLLITIGGTFLGGILSLIVLFVLRVVPMAGTESDSNTNGRTRSRSRGHPLDRG